MTSLSAPDYVVKVDAGAEINKKLKGLSGNTFSITLMRKNIKGAINGMVIISALDEQVKYHEKLRINLWIDSEKAIMPINEKVLITLNEACDPIHQFSSDQEALRSTLPVSFHGEVTHL